MTEFSMVRGRCSWILILSAPAAAAYTSGATIPATGGADLLMF